MTLLLQNQSETEAFINSGVTLVGSKYAIVKLNSSELVEKNTVDTNIDVFVLQNEPAANKIAELAGTQGKNTKIQIGAAGSLAIGVELMCDANGRVVAATTGKAVIGILLENVAAGAAGRIAIMKIAKYFKP